jgi:hypothetical protein
LFVRDKNNSNNLRNNFEIEASFKIFDFIYTECQIDDWKNRKILKTKLFFTLDL